MKVLMGQVGSGKTTELLNECLANDGMFVVSNVAQREMIKDQLRDRGAKPEVLDRVISINTLVNHKLEIMRKHKGSIYIDNIEYCLRALIGTDNISFSCNFDEVLPSKFMGRDLFEFTTLTSVQKDTDIVHPRPILKNSTDLTSWLPKIEMELPKEKGSDYSVDFKYVDLMRLRDKLRDYFKSNTILETEDDDQIDIAFNNFLLEGAYCHYFDQKEVPDVRNM